MSNIITGFAKAETPFGPLAGRTTVEVNDNGENCVIVTFRCGTTPVQIALAGAHYHDFVKAIIDKASAPAQEIYNERLAEVINL